MTKQEIICRIVYFRKRAKLTQKALSLAIGMNQNYINRLENQKDFLPSLEALLKIIEVCKSTPEEFFCRSPEYYRYFVVAVDARCAAREAFPIIGHPVKEKP